MRLQKAEAEAVTKRPGPKYRTTKSRTTKCLSRHPTKAPATGRPWFAACRQWFAACGQWFVACRQWFAACGQWFVACGQTARFQMAVVVVQRHHMGLLVAVVGPVIAAQVVVVPVPVPSPQ